jgi:hypothetical protein
VVQGQWVSLQQLASFAASAGQPANLQVKTTRDYARAGREALDANPWEAGLTWNLTSQAHLKRTALTLAAKLAKQAGVEMIPSG